MHHAYIDKFAYQNSVIHQLDSRVKFLVTLAFTVMVLSLSRTSVSILTCCAVGPFAVLVLAKIPLRFAFKQILLVSPFVLILALSCPLYDKSLLIVSFGPLVLQISAGWMRCFAILGKFVVTMLALIALVSTTRFGDLLAGLGRLGVPKLLIIQLGLLYRYIFVLIDRAGRILRARAGRKRRNLGLKPELKIAAAMIGSLLIRSIETAEHINIAMHGRGFDGNWRSLSELKIHRRDIWFGSIAATFMLLLYFFARPILQ
jgi:cobalt/nickel transport system permease protein